MRRAIAPSRPFSLHGPGRDLLPLKPLSAVREVTDSCKQYGGFYLGSVGGAAAVGFQESYDLSLKTISAHHAGSCRRLHQKDRGVVGR